MNTCLQVFPHGNKNVYICTKTTWTKQKNENLTVLLQTVHIKYQTDKPCQFNKFMKVSLAEFEWIDKKWPPMSKAHNEAGPFDQEHIIHNLHTMWLPLKEWQHLLHVPKQRSR